MITGTIGIFEFFARINPPLFMVPILPSIVLVPSGKITMFRLFFNSLAVSFKDSMAFFAFSLFMGIEPIVCKMIFNTGTEKSSSFERYVTPPGNVEERRGISRFPLCVEKNSTGEGGISSFIVNLTFIPRMKKRGVNQYFGAAIANDTLFIFGYMCRYRVYNIINKVLNIIYINANIPLMYFMIINYNICL